MNDTDLTIRAAQAIDETSSREAVLEAISAVEFLAQAARQAKQELERGVIAWINEHGEIEHGDLRYYVGTVKRTKPKSLLTLADRVLHHTGGDLEAFCEQLSANAFKPGSVRKLVGDEFDDLFEVEVVEDLKTGKPKKQVKKIDARFVRD